MEIEWEEPGLVIVRVRGRVLRVGGESLFDRDPDFAIYPSFIGYWEDGSAISDEEKAAVLDDLVDEAAKRGWKFEIRW
jgi:hypothetical protein